MPDEARLLAAFAVALGSTFALTPVAIGVATRAGFHDLPVGYKGHKAPTPYLGGTAVVGGFLLAALTLGATAPRLLPIPLAAVAVWALGTLDDRLSLPVSVRLSVEAAVATGLWATGVGWDIAGSDAVDLAVTIVWVVGLINAFNLMDNMDGAAATVASVTALATAIIAVTRGDVALAAVCVGMCGACAGFLPYNLSAPARIFLGDGGSLPIGVVIAATTMALPRGQEVGVPLFLAALILAGLPVVDTTLVMISRRRSGVPLFRGGRDHLTHRLLPALATPRTVAMALGLFQAALGAVAIGVVQLGSGEIVAAWCIWFAVVAFTVYVLETETWAPQREPLLPAGVPARQPRLRRPTPSVVEAAMVALITFAGGISPLLNGFYDPGIWAPITLVMLATLLGLAIARPASPRPMALVGVGALGGLWIWSLLSTTWSESIDNALTDTNRWLLYAVLFAILVLLLRNDRLARILFASLTVSILGLSLYLVGALLFGDGSGQLHQSRLEEPIGYANAQAACFMLGFWPLMAVIERSRHRVWSSAAVSGAILLAGLVVLTQTRAAVVTFFLTAVLLVILLPGRHRRLWALVTIVAGVLAAAGPLLRVSDTHRPDRIADPAALHSGVLALIGAAFAGGLVWSLGGAAVERYLGPGTGRFRMRGRLSLVALATLACAALVSLLALTGNPARRVSDQWHAFVSLDRSRLTSTASQRLTSGGGNRYDYWRVAVEEFRSQPVHGLGAGNYDRDYFLRRQTHEDVTQPHSLELQLLAELGIVGLAVFGLFLAAIAAGARRRVRAARGDPMQTSLVLAAIGVFLTWLLHTSVDWLHTFPGITGIAFFAAAVLVSPWGGRVRFLAGRRIALVAACGLVAVAGGFLVGRSALAQHYRSESQDALEKDPALALRRAQRSLNLNDEALPSYYAKSAAYARLDRYEDARAVLLQAARKEPHDFVPWALLGDLAVRRGELRQAKSNYVHAFRLNPRDGTLAGLAGNPTGNPG